MNCIDVGRLILTTQNLENCYKDVPPQCIFRSKYELGSPFGKVI